MGNIRNKETGKYNWSTIMLALILTGVLLWQGVFAALGGTDAEEYVYTPDLGYVSVEAMAAGIETFSAGAGSDLGAIWRNAVANPTAAGGVWDRFWTDASAVMANGGDSVRVGNINIAIGGSAIGTVFTCSNGFVWRVIGSRDRSLLIILEQGETTRIGDNVTEIHAATTAWAELNLAPELRAIMRTSNSAPIMASGPGAASTVSSSVFPLSQHDFFRYFGHSAENGGKHSAGTLFTANGGFVRQWWLACGGAWVDFDGQLVLSTTTRTLNIRPVLWIGG